MNQNKMDCTWEKLKTIYIYREGAYISSENNESQI